MSSRQPWRLLFGAVVAWIIVFVSVVWDIKRDGPSAQLYRMAFHSHFISIDGSAECNNTVVPNHVHWIWFHEFPSTFRFHHYLSAMSVLRLAEPGIKIYFWYDTHPQGRWWTELQNNLRNSSLSFFPHQMHPPTEIYGRKVNMPEHQADIVKYQKLLDHGGLYLDFDVIMLRSWRTLRCYPCTLGMEIEGRLCAGIILASQGSKFLKLWLDSYRTFNDADWDAHAVRMPYYLWRRHPHVLHIESHSLQHPTWEKHDLPYLYGRGMYYDWVAKQNFAIHLWYRFYNIDHDPNSIRTLDSTVGQLFRLIYYEDKKLLPSVNGDHSKEIYMHF